MMKTYFFPLLVTVILLLQPVSAHADSYTDHHKATPFYAEIVEAAKTKQGRELVQYFHEELQKNPQRADAISIWLRDNAIKQQDVSKIDALYFLSYADVLFFMAPGYQRGGQAEAAKGLLETAMMTLYAYEYMATMDALRCDDKSVLGAMRQNTLASRISDPAVKETYKLFPQESFDLFAKVAVQLEQKLAQRPPNRFICSMGMAKMADLLKQPGVQKKETKAEGYVGGGKAIELIAPEGYRYQPVYVPDDEWNVRRGEMKGRLIKNWQGRYRALSGKAAAK